MISTNMLSTKPFKKIRSPGPKSPRSRFSLLCVSCNVNDYLCIMMNFWPEEWRKPNNNNKKNARDRLPSDIDCPRWELLCLRWSPVKMEFLKVTIKWSDSKNKIRWNSNIVGTVYPWVIEGQLRKWRMKNRVVCHFSWNLKVCSRISSSFLLKKSYHKPQKKEMLRNFT